MRAIFRCAERYAPRGKRNIYHIATEGYIAFAQQIYRVAKQHIDKKRVNIWDCLIYGALFEESDDVFYEHEQLIIDILYEAAKNFPM